LTQEELERIEGHALWCCLVFSTTSREREHTRAIRQQRPKQIRPFSRRANSLRLTAGMINSPRIPSSVEFSSNVWG
jgi:hypothetical protein